MKVKLLKDLPGIETGTIINMDDWNNLLTNRYNPQEHPDWFEIIEEPKFKVGDWVYDDFYSKAVKILHETGYYAETKSAEWCNDKPFRYNRLATEEEIKSVTEKRMVINNLDSFITNNHINFRYGSIHVNITRKDIEKILSEMNKLQPR